VYIEEVSDDRLDELLSEFGWHLDNVPDGLFDDDDLDFIERNPFPEEEEEEE
jgi:hypothetical protein